MLCAETEAQAQLAWAAAETEAQAQPAWAAAGTAAQALRGVLDFYLTVEFSSMLWQ